MKTFKPDKLGLLFRTFENNGDCFLCVGTYAYFPFAGGVLSEASMWKFLPKQLGKNAEFDASMPKPRGELVVHGRAFPPGKRAAPACRVRAQLGPVDKTLHVIGNRTWRRDGTFTEAEPFTEMPIDWEHAFGGEGFEFNPRGKGAKPVTQKDGKVVHPLPNVEDPRRPVRTPGDKPRPAGFAPLDFSWPQRFSKMGTYDERWLRERFPGFAADIDMTVFNVTAEDQWAQGYFRGDETFLLENLHPDRPMIEGALPSLASRVFITRKGRENELVELQTRLDTVWMFPHAERGVLGFRALAQVEEDDAHDVAHLMIALEDLAAPRPYEHYEAAFRERTAKETGPLVALAKQSDLLPAQHAPRGDASAEETTALTGKSAYENLQRRNARERVRKMVAESQERLKSLGADPTQAMTPEIRAMLEDDAPPPDPERAAELMVEANARMEASKAESERVRAAAEERARASFAAAGLDYDDEMQKAQREAAGPPKPTVRRELERLRTEATRANNGKPVPEIEALFNDPEKQAQMELFERKSLEAYKLSAHLRFPAQRLAGAANEQMRVAIQQARARRESFAGRDLTGANLSGLDLSGADFSDALMENVVFANANLRGANFSRAVLVRADFTGANASGANFNGANAGHGNFERADVSGADFTGARLSNASFARANARGATLAQVFMEEARFNEADLSGIKSHTLLFIKTDLTGTKFVGADLTRGVFLEAKLAGVDFTDANLSHCAMVTVNAERAVFRNATAPGLRAVVNSNFERADFTGAKIPTATLRNCHMVEADLSSTKLDRSDFGESNLAGAKFYKAEGRGTMFIRADLTEASLVSSVFMEALFQKAMIQGADFRGANLFRADFARTRGAARGLNEAFTKRVRVYPLAKQRHGQK